MRLPNGAHASRPWRIHEVVPDFEIEDVWMLSTPGGADEFPRLVSQFVTGNWPDGAPLIVRFVWKARWKLGAVFGWDREGTGVGSRVTSLRGKLPADLRDAPHGQQVGPFVSIYQLKDEWAAELANRTVHTVMHLGWVPDGSSGYQGQMTALVKPNGLFGRAYMAVIKPFRYFIVYPVLLSRIESAWTAASAQSMSSEERG